MVDLFEDSEEIFIALSHLLSLLWVREIHLQKNGFLWLFHLWCLQTLVVYQKRVSILEKIDVSLVNVLVRSIFFRKSRESFIDHFYFSNISRKREERCVLLRKMSILVRFRWNFFWRYFCQYCWTDLIYMWVNNSRQFIENGANCSQLWMNQQLFLKFS